MKERNKKKKLPKQLCNLKMANLVFLCFDLQAKILKCNLVYVKTHNETKNTEKHKNNKN